MCLPTTYNIRTCITHRNVCIKSHRSGRCVSQRLNVCTTAKGQSYHREMNTRKQGVKETTLVIVMLSPNLHIENGLLMQPIVCFQRSRVSMYKEISTHSLLCAEFVELTLSLEKPFASQTDNKNS